MTAFARKADNPLSSGIVPTPAVALITREMGADCGIVISASHNPPEYNGIKFFDGQGYKLPDALEDEMQELVEGAARRAGRDRTIAPRAQCRPLLRQPRGCGAAGARRRPFRA